MTTGQTVLLGVLLLSWAVWFGGLVTIAIVTLSARDVLDTATRVEFLRDLGRRYFPVGAVALAVSLVSGFVLLVQRPWSPAATVAVVLGVVLAVSLVAGVVQARRMTALRQLAATGRDGGGAVAEVEAAARRAAALRGTLAVLTLALFVVALLSVS